MTVVEDISAAPPVRAAADEASEESRARASLRALDALLDLDGEEPVFPDLFDALRAVFGHDHALVLEETELGLACVAAEPAAPSSPALIGAHWPREDFSADVLSEVVVLDGAREATAAPSLPHALAPPGEPALSVPVAVRGRRAALLLRRGAGREEFGVAAIAFARQCAVVTLAARVARGGKHFAAETEGLRREIEELRAGAWQAQEDRAFLNNLVEVLPIGLTVQDEEGRFLLVNAAAAANLDMPADALVGGSPADFLPAEEAQLRREWELSLLQSLAASTIEETVAGADGTEGARTWLASHQGVTIGGRPLLVSAALDITARKRVEEQLTRHAYFDDLTGLPNRVLIHRRVEEVLQRKDERDRFALAFIDLDNFKHINDYYSHAIGDALLIKVAERIRKALRDTDMLARISGDEFLLLVEPVEGEQQVQALVGTLIGELKQPFQIEAFEVFTSASIGVSLYPEHGASYEALRRNADSAMYRAKNGVKGEAIYFDPSIGERITARMELEQRLRLAIRDRKFCCAFQPKVDIHTQEVVGFETLVRWRDEDGELQPPGAFIGLAIELGLIDPITHFVLEEAIASIGRLDQAFGGTPSISVNVAAKQAGDVIFMSALAHTIKESGYAERIMLELTEDAFVAKSRFQSQVLPMLREIGVRVSIDDFGTGYSSLSVLADITADEIKVDRSFITDIHRRPRSQSVLRTIESLAFALGMTIVAEGVETFEELAYLQATTRIRYAQGFYYSKPFFLDEIRDARQILADGRAPDAAHAQESRRAYVGRETERPRFGR